MYRANRIMNNRTSIMYNQNRIMYNLTSIMYNQNRIMYNPKRWLELCIIRKRLLGLCIIQLWLYIIRLGLYIIQVGLCKMRTKIRLCIIQKKSRLCIIKFWLCIIRVGLYIIRVGLCRKVGRATKSGENLPAILIGLWIIKPPFYA